MPHSGIESPSLAVARQPPLGKGAFRANTVRPYDAASTLDKTVGDGFPVPKTGVAKRHERQ